MIVALLAAALCSAQVGETPRPIPAMWTAEGTPWTVGQGNGSAGLFAPARFGITDRLELRTTGLFSLVAPNVLVKQTLAGDDTAAVAVTGRLTVPVGLGLTKGLFIPSNRSVGVPTVLGVGAIGGVRFGANIVSFGLEARLGIKVGDFDVDPPDLFFFDTLVAPLTEGPRLTGRLLFEYFPGMNPIYIDSAGVTVELRGHLGGLGPDTDARVLGVYRLSRNLVVGAGGVAAYERLTTGYFLSFAPLLDLQVRW